MLISVGICTYNRSDDLTNALTGLTLIQLPESLQWELLIIDNNSTDNTREIAGRYQSKLPLRYVFESQQGLSYARNRAIRELRRRPLLPG
jgi:glycosyltransferase involved in cell wall biosynthesis